MEAEFMLTEKWSEADVLAVLNGVRELTAENEFAYYENFFEHRFQNERCNSDETEEILSRLELAAKRGDELAGALLGKAILLTYERKQVVEDGLSFLTRAMRKGVRGAALALCEWYVLRLQLDDAADFVDEDVGLSDCYPATDEFPRVAFPKDNEEFLARMFACATTGDDCRECLPYIVLGMDIVPESVGRLSSRLNAVLCEKTMDDEDISPFLYAERLLDCPQSADATETAVTLLTRGAEAGNAYALASFGKLLLEGTHPAVKQDIPRAFAYLREGALENAMAQGLLSKCYEQGLGTEVDLIRASVFLEKAAAAGDPESCVRLGRRLVEGATGDTTSKDVRRGCELIRQAAEESDYLPAWEAMLEYHDKKIGPFKTNKFARAAREALKELKA